MPDIRLRDLVSSAPSNGWAVPITDNSSTTFKTPVHTNNTANSIVFRDAGGNFSAGTITAAAITGSASSSLQNLNVPGTLTAGTFNPTNVNASGTVNAAGGFVTGGNVSCGTLRAAGDVIAYASSDSRLKDNVQVISNALGALEHISGYEFTFNDKADQALAGKTAYGVIAQEVEASLPHAVVSRKDGFKGVSYDQLVGVLLQAVKELKAQVDKLKAEVA
jgi:hypothetical protein